MHGPGKLAREYRPGCGKQPYLQTDCQEISGVHSLCMCNLVYAEGKEMHFSR